MKQDCLLTVVPLFCKVICIVSRSSFIGILIVSAKTQTDVVYPTVMTASGVLRRGLIPNVEGGIAPPMSLNELLYDNVNLDVSQSYAFECGLILKHPL